jgi:hypothetical protein
MDKEEFAQRIIEEYDMDTLMDTAIKGILDHWERYPEDFYEEQKQRQDILKGESVDVDRRTERFFIPFMTITRLDVKSIMNGRDDASEQKQIINNLSTNQMQFIADKMPNMMMYDYHTALRKAYENSMEVFKNEN